MDSTLQESFDKWEASFNALCRYLEDASTTPAPASTSSDVTGFVTASSDTDELVISSAGLAARLVLVLASGEPLAVTPAAPIDTATVVPTTCSTECAVQAVPASTLLPLVSVSSSSPATSATNGVVCIELELAHDNDTDEHDNSNDSTPLPPAPKGRSTECAPACSEPKQDTFQIAGVTTAALLHEGIPELVVEPMAVPLLVASSPLTLADYNLSTNGISAAAVSLAIADGNEARPLPWPAFKGINDCESSSDAIMKPSRRCTSDSFPTTIADAVEFQIPNYYGNLCTSTSYISIHEMCSASELICWNDVLLFREYGWFGSAGVPSAHTVVVMSCEHLVVDITDCTGSSLSVGSSVVGYPEFPVQSPIYFFLASESVTWLDTMDGHLLDFPCSALATNCSACSQEPGHHLNNYQLKMLVTAAGHRMILARFQKGQKNSHMLLLPWVWEQEELSLGFQFHQNRILPEWYLGNKSIVTRVRPDYSFNYNLLADTWRSRLLCVKSVCAAVHAPVLPDEKHSWNWHSPQPAVGQDALLFIIQPLVLNDALLFIIQLLVLNYMVYWWLTTALLTVIVSIFSARFPVQPKLLLAHAYQLASGAHYSESLPSMTETSVRTFVVIIQDERTIVFLIWATTVEGDRTIRGLTETDYGLPLEVIPYSDCHALNLALASGAIIWQIAWSLIYGSSSSENMKMGGNEVLIIRFRRGKLLELLASAYNLFPGGTGATHKVQNSRKFTSSNQLQEEIYIKSSHLNYPVVKRTPDASHYGGDGTELARASPMWLVAWTVDGLEFSIGCKQAPFQGGRNFIEASFFDQVHVSCDYYLDHAYHFDTSCNDFIYNRTAYLGDCRKSKEVHMPWDPGKLVSRDFSKLRLGDKPSFKEGGMLGAYSYSADTVAGLASWASIWAWPASALRSYERSDTSTWEETAVKASSGSRTTAKGRAVP